METAETVTINKTKLKKLVCASLDGYMRKNPVTLTQMKDGQFQALNSVLTIMCCVHDHTKSGCEVEIAVEVLRLALSGAKDYFEDCYSQYSFSMVKGFVIEDLTELRELTSAIVEAIDVLKSVKGQVSNKETKDE